MIRSQFELLACLFGLSACQSASNLLGEQKVSNMHHSGFGPNSEISFDSTDWEKERVLAATTLPMQGKGPQRPLKKCCSIMVETSKCR